MKITSLKIDRFADDAQTLMGVATIVFDDMIAIHNIKVVTTEDKRFLSMPSIFIKRAHRYYDAVHPIKAEGRKALEDIIFAAYENCIAADSFRVLYRLPDTDEKASLVEQSLSDFVLIEE